VKSEDVLTRDVTMNTSSLPYALTIRQSMRKSCIGSNIIKKTDWVHMPVKKCNNMRKAIFILAMLTLSLCNYSQVSKWKAYSCSIENNISEQTIDIPVDGEIIIEVNFEKNKVFVYNNLYSTYRLDKFTSRVEESGTVMMYYEATDEDFIKCVICIATWKENSTKKMMLYARYSDISVCWTAKPYNKEAKQTFKHQMEL
jgi:hypothetical protein